MPYIHEQWVAYQKKRWMRHDAKRFLRPSLHATELKFDPNQPRVPRGNPNGGQWLSLANTDNAGSLKLVGGVSPDVAAECLFMHRNDLFVCRTVQSFSCYGQAYLRYSNCLNGRPIPPLNF